MKIDWKSTIIGFVIVIVALSLVQIIANPPVLGDGPKSYDFYNGPVLPLTAVSGGEQLAVERRVGLDFTYYGQEKDPFVDAFAGVTDEYTLTNPSAESITVELAYGFFGSLGTEPAQVPQILVDGEAVEQTLLVSMDPEMLLFNAEDFDAYQAVMTEQDFLANAQEPPALWDQKVTVYHFTDYSYSGTETEESVYLDVTYGIQENITVWKFGTIGTATDDREHHMIRIPGGPVEETAEEAYLVVFGGELTGLQVSGNIGDKIEDDSGTADIHYEMEQYEADFADVLMELAGKYLEYMMFEEVPLATQQLLFDGAMKRISGPDTEIRYNSISNLFYKVCWEKSMLYWVFSLEIPANAEVTVTASYGIEASHDTFNFVQERGGYDLAVQLGSNLNFTKLSVSATNHESITILGQNMGLELKSGVVQADLDTSEERYYLDIERK